MNLLVTGGAGYIGSHIVYEALDRGLKVTVFDDLSSGCLDNIPPEVKFIRGSTLSITNLSKLFADSKFDAVIHLAASKAAGRSMLEPEYYSKNNILGSINLINLCSKNDIRAFVFSSSAAVYGVPKKNPVEEMQSLSPTNYYGFTKLLIEDNLKWFSRLKGLRYASLRYFNAAGYDLKKRILNIENNPQNLIPLIMEVAVGKRKKVKIYGNDYDTKDGTGVRDYVHVSDLAKAHINSIEYIREQRKDLIVNLGSGTGHTVFDILSMVEKVADKKLEYSIQKRRNGDTDILIAKPDLARKLINWKPEFSSLETIISSTWDVYKSLVIEGRKPL